MKNKEYWLCGSTDEKDFWFLVTDLEPCVDNKYPKGFLEGKLINGGPHEMARAWRPNNSNFIWNPKAPGYYLKKVPPDEVFIYML